MIHRRLCVDVGICPYGVTGQSRFQTTEKHHECEETGEGRVMSMPSSNRAVLYHIALAYVS